jgi:thiamine-phosphate pyrophosphorylase
LKFPTTGLYAITHTEHKKGEHIIAEVTAALQGGAVVVQYRDKNPSDAVSLAQALLSICHAYHAPLIINDDIALAATIGADGVHLGQQDGNILQAQHQLGKEAIIGISCYNSLERAMAAQQQGASYVAFGRFFPSHSKPLAAPAQFETLTAAKKHLTVPIVAIGGILPENGELLLQAGADILAVIGGIFDPKTGVTVTAAAQAYCALFEH